MDERKHVQIIVTGYPGAGKTTIATIIYEALKAKGFKHVALDDEEGLISSELRDFRTSSLIESENAITIQTRQLRRLWKK